LTREENDLMQELNPIDKAIAAHARWKSQLRKAIETGTSDYIVDKVRPDEVASGERHPR
jgi:hypothetical protein